MSPTRTREDRIERKQRTCVHFNGTMRKVCEAGVSYEELTGGGSGWGNRLPCLGDAETPVYCFKKMTRSYAEAEQEIDEDDRHDREYIDDIAEGLCPRCESGNWAQVERCVYCNGCGHRLYQGTLPKTKSK